MDDGALWLFWRDPKSCRCAETPQPPRVLATYEPMYGEMRSARALVHDLPTEVMAHVLNGVDSLGRPLFDPLWRFAARSTCRRWRDIVDAPTTVEARAMVRAWRYGRAERKTRRVHCLCAPCTHNDGGGLKHLIATGRLVTATCAVALGAQSGRLGDDDDRCLFGAHHWCASSIPEQDEALCTAMAAPTRDALDRVVRNRLAPLFACDADGQCPVRMIERADLDDCAQAQRHSYLADMRCVEADPTAYDDGRTLIVDLLAVSARQGRVDLLASLTALSERVRAVTLDAVGVVVYYACMADRADTVAWVLRGVMDTGGALASEHPLSLARHCPMDYLRAYLGRAWSDVWKAIATYDAADSMVAVFNVLGQYAVAHPDAPCNAKWAPDGERWQRRAARSGSTRVLGACQKYRIALDLDLIVREAAAHGCGSTVRWALAHRPIAEPKNRCDVYWEALDLAATERARGHDRDADTAIDCLCDAIRATCVSPAEAAQAATAWWRTGDWDRRRSNTRDCASAARVASRWRDFLLDNLGPDDVIGLFRSAMHHIDYKALDVAVSLFAGRRAAQGVDLWAVTLDYLDAVGVAMQPYRRHSSHPNPYGSPPLRFNRPWHSADLRPVHTGDFFFRMDQSHAVEMLMFLASVCAHRTRVGLATRAQWRSVCAIEPIDTDRVPSIDMGDRITTALPAWLDARGLLARPS
ncbi:F-box incomplete domain containing protein [Pandoravirus salinus]|uniref:F-box incomplete domain containing protein n=1 Tax=Pandoravirus salinus TaxID=1349410 RepID=S4VT26_9VIRU|nr:F-box incomplete domain [Pandoravirus salinus]AGO83599.1 F-box incomplete domain containing protein [Pandoravirus salinus]